MQKKKADEETKPKWRILPLLFLRYTLYPVHAEARRDLQRAGARELGAAPLRADARAGLRASRAHAHKRAHGQLPDLRALSERALERWGFT